MVTPKEILEFGLEIFGRMPKMPSMPLDSEMQALANSMQNKDGFLLWRIKHLIIGETYKYDLCSKCHHTIETLRTHEFCIWLIRVGIRQGFNLFRFEIDRM